ncbi:radial spoke head 10 homolog B isoform X3 [Megalobrama amblycephala]|uniref:radial spoke head 10 homolog B isoform X3 n=1 Tax=Megalobrama amblycephala TaxID=75352 RepID=UPI0020141DD4|nr:radial spoke head 10 homolog B isoform X3 [Megalobrama amblycephala]
MAKEHKMKSSNRFTPEPTLSKVLGQSSTSSVVSESVTEPDDGRDSSRSAACSSNAVSQHTNDHRPNNEHDQCRKVPILHHIIVERYEGDKCGEMFHGEGVAYFQGGHIYKGSFSHGLMHGSGEYIWLDGLKYQGDFKCNVPMGHGTYTWLDGSTYEGEIHQGIRHGVGMYKCFKTSTVYRGQWYLGKRQGQGVMYYNQAFTSWYKGDWVNNRREGWGKRCYPSGNVYEGQWKNSVRHGEGTMRWVQLDQQYSGQWVNGIQDGKGTHTWFCKKVPFSQYPRMNEYTGEFVQGMRHGRGQFLYASGAVYSGEWKHDKKHGPGRYTFENGHVYEGEFNKDCMAEFPAFTPGLSGITTPFPDESKVLNDSSKRSSQSSTNSPLGSDMVLNIQTLLNRVPEAHRDQELKQVEYAVLRHIGLLREIYSFYSSLGHEQSPDNIFPLTHLQFSRFLMDCKVHQHRVTQAQIERLITDQVHSPFTAILPRECISYIVIVAYHICHKDIESSNNILATCFSKLMRQNIIPNAKNVKGSLFCHPVHAAVACHYSDRCWEIYQALCKANSIQPNQVLTARLFVWLLKDLCLYDSELTVSKVLEILSVDSPAIHDGIYSNLDLEISFLEFFEALLGCAEVKGQRIQTDVESQTDTSHWDDTVKNITELSSNQWIIISAWEKANQTISIKAVSSFDIFQSSLSEEMEQRQSPVLAFKEKDWIQKTQQFFTQTFFPAYEHSVKLKEKRLKLREKNRIALSDADKPRHTEQLEAEERQDEEEAPNNDVNRSPPFLP